MSQLSGNVLFFLPLLLITVFLDSCSDKNSDVIKITADELITEFENDEKASFQKYKNKIIRISGEITVKEFPKDHVPLRNASRIIFGKVNERGSPFFSENTIIVCNFDKIVVHELNEGDSIIIQCRFKDFVTAYKQMKEIILIKGKIISEEVVQGVVDANFEEKRQTQ